MAVLVDNESRLERVPMERHDWWFHGGLLRPVRLEATGAVFVRHAAVTTEVLSSPARVHVKVDWDALEPSTGKARIEAVLTDAGGTVAARIQEDAAEKTVLLELPVEQPRLWTPDTPYLYELSVSVLPEGESAASDVWRQHIGLRTIEVRDGRLWLNGEPFLVKGVNRYEDYPETGGAANDALLMRDIALVKELGANAVRCHYPYATKSYDRLDEMGVFAVCEVPLYQWGRPGHCWANAEAAQQQLTEMIETLGNHPSIMMWSVSNENRIRPREEGEEHARLSEMVVKGNRMLVETAHRLDSSRPVIEPSNRWPEDVILDETDLCSVNVYIGISEPRVDRLSEMEDAVQERFQALRGPLSRQADSGHGIRFVGPARIADGLLSRRVVSGCFDRNPMERLCERAGIHRRFHLGFCGFRRPPEIHKYL